MKLSCSIMAHPVRQDQVTELCEQLDRTVPVVWDPKPVSSDPEQRWANGRRAWEQHDSDADYHLALQDDALVCDDFLAGLEKALEVFGPDGLVSAYAGQGRPDQRAIRASIARAEAANHAWCASWSLNWGIAIIAPVRTIPQMLRWCDKRMSWNYDVRVGRFYRDIIGWRCWHTLPSLVEHRDQESLINHGSGPPRVAHKFYTGSALAIDWTAVPNSGLDPLIDPELRHLGRDG